MLGQFQNDLIRRRMQRLSVCVKQGSIVYKEETKLASSKCCLFHEAADSLSIRDFLLLDVIYIAQAGLELAM